MTNLQKYKNVFIEIFKIDDNEVESLKHENCLMWDSVGQLELISALEQAFDIFIEADDAIEILSFKKGQEILSKKYNVEF